MHYVYPPQSDTSHEIKSAILRFDGSVYVKDSQRSFEATNAPAKLTQIALTGQALWALDRKGRLYRWNHDRSDSQWLLEDLPARVYQLHCLEDGRLVTVSKSGQALVLQPATENKESSWAAEKEVTQWIQPRRQPARVRFRFGLRSILAASMLLALILGPWNAYQKEQKRLEAIAFLREKGVEIRYAHEFDENGVDIPNPIEPGPEWLKSWLGRESLLTPVEVKFTERDDSRNGRQEPAWLARLTTLKRVNLGHELNCFRDADLDPLASLKQLEVIEGGLTYYLTDLGFLANLTKLKELEIGLSYEADASIQLKNLSNLTRLKKLCLRADVGDGTVISKLTNLEELEINGQIESLDPLMGLKKLRRLEYLWDKASLHPYQLAHLTKLEELECSRHNKICKSVDWAKNLSSLTFLDVDYHQLKNTSTHGPASLVFGTGKETELKEFLDLSNSDAKFFNSVARCKQLGCLYLDLDGARVKSLEPLQTLQKLNKVYLSETQVTDLSPLAGKPIQRLTANHAPIKDISILKSFTKLKNLDINGTRVTDLSALAMLSELEGLGFSDTNVDDLSPLKNFQGSFVDLSGTLVNSIQPLAGKDLESLSLNRTSVSDLSCLAGAKIKSIGASDSAIKNLEWLRNETSSEAIEMLDVSGTEVTDLSPLEGSSLTDLDLSNTSVTDFQPLGTLRRLEKLDLSDTPIDSLRPIRRLRSLSDLDLSGTQVKDLSDIEKLVRPHNWLNLSGVPVTDFSPLREIRRTASIDLSSTSFSKTDHLPLEVEELNLADTPVRKLGEIKDLNKLDLSRTLVTDLTSLKNDLKALKLSGTRVSDFSPLSKFDRLKTFDASHTSFDDPGLLLLSKDSLTELDISHSAVKDLLWLPDFLELRILKLAGTKVVDLSPIEKLPPYELDELDLAGCEIVDLGPLSHLRGLLRLRLNCKNVNELPSLSNMKVLESLVLEDVSTKLDLSSLADFKFLYELTITGEVGDIDQLSKLYRVKRLHLPAGTEVPDGFVAALPTLHQLFVGEKEVWSRRKKRLEDSISKPLQ